MKDKKIVFCGGGNMTEGIVRGLFKNGASSSENITVSEIIPERCSYLSKTYGVTALADATEAIKDACMVVISVKPLQVQGVASMLKSLVNEKTIVMSIAAGITLATLESHMGNDKKIVRMMPNTLSQSGNGYSAVCINGNVSDNEMDFIAAIADALGQTVYIKEEMFNAFTAFSCTGPLWLYKTVEAMIDAGVYVGFARAQARSMVIKNMLGVAQVLEATDAHPVAKVDEMTSPGGITIEALKAIREGGLEGVIMASVDAALKKANTFK